jgi:hypothetical protein
MATKEEITFDEQSFMWDFIDIFKNVVDGRLAFPVQYKNFIQLKDNKMPSLTLNMLTGQGIDGLEGLTNSQLSALIPKMRLYKVVDNRSIEFPFNKFTTVESITMSALGRGTDVGIKSISLRDVGTNPVNVGVSFEGDLNLFFQSFEAIFKERNVGEDKISFADLLDQPKALGRKQGTETSTESLANIPPNYKKFDIRLEIGWQPPSDPEGVLGFKESQLKEIEKLTRSYILQNANQVIDINQEDASINLKISFYAAIEGLTLSPRTDILYIDPSNTTDKDTIERKKLDKKIESLKNKRKEIIKKEKDRQEKERTFVGPRRPPQGEEAEEDKKTDGGTAVANFKKQIKEVEESIEKIISESRSISYKRLLTNLRNNFSDVETDAKGNTKKVNSIGKIRYFDLTAANIESYKSILAAASNSTDQRKAFFENNKEGEQVRDKVQELEETYLKNRVADINTLKGQIKITPEIAEGEELESRLTSLLDQDKIVTNKTFRSQIKDGKMRIYYFYLGDLIESVFDIIYNRPVTKDGSKMATNSETRNKKLYEKLKMILGPFSYYNPLEQKSASIQMADIPISLNYFNAWFYDNVVKRQLDNYVLRQLLSDLCSKLLSNVLSPKRIGVLAQSKSYKIRIQSLNTNENSNFNQEWLERRNQSKPRYDINELDLVGIKEKTLPTKNISEWLYMYVVGEVEDFLATESRNDESFNARKNIPRYYIGGQTGLIKNVSFARTQIPFKFEAALTDQSKTTRNNLLFQDKYDANVELFGNPTLKPGMLIYLDPRGLGLGNINTVTKTGFQYQLGIGGYYRVVRVTNDIGDGIFTTSIQTVAELDLRDIQLIREKGNT